VTVIIGAPGFGVDAAGLGPSTVDVTGATNLQVTVTPAVSDAEGVPAPARMRVAGDFTTDGVAAANYRALAGTVTYDGKAFDLASVDYSGAVTAQDHLDRLSLSALAFFGTPHTPFTATATALHFTGETPGAGSTAGDAVALTPTYTGRSGAGAAIPMVDRAVRIVSSLRAYLGAVENRFQHTISRLNVAMENTTASVSRIRGADIAAEMTSLTRSQVLSQAGTAMLSQANQAPRTVLTLLG
jgi:flagellin